MRIVSLDGITFDIWLKLKLGIGLTFWLKPFWVIEDAGTEVGVDPAWLAVGPPLWWGVGVAIAWPYTDVTFVFPEKIMNYCH